MAVCVCVMITEFESSCTSSDDVVKSKTVTKNPSSGERLHSHFSVLQLILHCVMCACVSQLKWLKRLQRLNVLSPALMM